MGGRQTPSQGHCHKAQWCTAKDPANRDSKNRDVVSATPPPMLCNQAPWAKCSQRELNRFGTFDEKLKSYRCRSDLYVAVSSSNMVLFISMNAFSTLYTNATIALRHREDARSASCSRCQRRRRRRRSCLQGLLPTHPPLPPPQLELPEMTHSSFPLQEAAILYCSRPNVLLSGSRIGKNKKYKFASLVPRKRLPSTS